MTCIRCHRHPHAMSMESLRLSASARRLATGWTRRLANHVKEVYEANRDESDLSG